MAQLQFEKELNGPRCQAVTALDGPVLIIAGAGSGKTRVITYRIAHMLERGIPQHAILALTFTNKAAREMEERVKELTGRKLKNLTVSTFHSFGAAILRGEIDKLGYRSNFSIYDETDRAQALKDALRECKINAETGDLYQLGQLFSAVKTEMAFWGDEKAAEEWRPVYEEYQQNLRVYNACDFDDLLMLPIKLFEEYPAVCSKYRERYRYIMIDEFQDTSFVQYKLMKLLAGQNICVVGDDDQSIYSWRGANYENIMHFEKDFPGRLEIKLEQNYRSTTTILEAANGVIAHNTSRKEKKLWTHTASGNAIELWTPENDFDEAQFIAERIRAMLREERRSYNDFGVLVRANHLFEKIEDIFIESEIPYRVSGGTSFYARKEVKDILSYLRVIGNTDDDVNLLRIINTPRRGIGKTAVAQVVELAKRNQSSVWSAMGQLRYAEGTLFQETAKEEFDDFMTFIERQRSEMLGKRGLSQKVRALINEIDYHGYLLAENSKNEKAAHYKYLNLEILLDSIAHWEKNPDNLDPTLYPYLNRISLITQDAGDLDANKGKVNIMTIHASKGLEFPVVFIAGAEDGIIPHERSLEDNAGSIEEERRLFYVAITRARDKLIITSCRKRKKNQTIVDRVPSPFLEEIPAHLLDNHDPDRAGAITSAQDFLSAMKTLVGS